MIARTGAPPGDLSRLKCFGLGEEFGYALEESAGTAAIEDAVIEAEGKLGLAGGLEGGGGWVPKGGGASNSHAEDEGLLRQGDGGGPVEAEGAVVGDRGDAATVIFAGEAGLAGEFD